MKRYVLFLAVMGLSAFGHAATNYYAIEFPQAGPSQAPYKLLLGIDGTTVVDAIGSHPHYISGTYGNIRTAPVSVSNIVATATNVSGDFTAQFYSRSGTLHAETMIDFAAEFVGSDLVGSYTGVYAGATARSGPVSGHQVSSFADDAINRAMVFLRTPYTGLNEDEGDLRLVAILELTNGVVTGGQIDLGKVAGTIFGGTVLTAYGLDAEGYDQPMAFLPPESPVVNVAASGGYTNGVLSASVVAVNGGLTNDYRLSLTARGNILTGTYTIWRDGVPTSHGNIGSGYVGPATARPITNASFSAIQRGTTNASLIAAAAAKGSGFQGPYFEPVTNVMPRLRTFADFLRRDPYLGGAHGSDFSTACMRQTGNKNYDDHAMQGAMGAFFGSLYARIAEDPELVADMTRLAKRGGYMVRELRAGPYSLPGTYKGDFWFSYWMGPAFLELYSLTGEQQWMDYALDYADTLERLQQPSGTWTWVDEESGDIGTSNERNDRSWDDVQLQYSENMCFLGRLRTEFGVNDFYGVEMKAYEWMQWAVTNRPIHNGRDYLWCDRRPGEAKDAMGPSFYALYLLDYAPTSSVSMVEDIIQVLEDEFMTWGAPTVIGSNFTPRVNGFAPRVGPGHNAAATMRTALALLKLYQRTGDEVDLARAQALAHSVMAMQDADTGLMWGAAIPDDLQGYAENQQHPYGIFKGEMAINLFRYYQLLDEMGLINGAPWARGEDVEVIDADQGGDELCSLVATNSVDFDGSIVSYRWLTNGQEIATGSLTNATFSVGLHSVVLEVVDDAANTSQTDVAVWVRPPLQGPSITNALAASPANPKKGEMVVFSVGAHDPDLTNSLLYTWSKLSGPGDVVFDGKTLGYGVEQTRAGFSVPGTYTVQVSIVDSDGLVTNAAVEVTADSTPHIGPFRFLRLDVTADALAAEIGDADWMVGATAYPTQLMTFLDRPAPLVVQSDTHHDLTAYRAYDKENQNKRWSVDANSTEELILDLGEGNGITPDELILELSLAFQVTPLRVVASASGDGISYLELYDTAKAYPAGVPWTSPITFPFNVPAAGEPFADYTVTPVTGACPVDVVFDASASFDSGGASPGISTYEWDFDGDDVFDLAGGPIVTNTYTIGGTYATKLRVTDLDANTHESTRLVIPVSAPIAVIDVSTNFGPVPLVVSFSGTNSYDQSAGTVELYEWDFDGDGNYEGTNTSGVTNWTFMTPGPVTVNLRVTDNDGESNVTSTALILMPNGTAGTHVESNGMVVMEGENFVLTDPRLDPVGATYTARSSIAGHVGTGYVGTANVTGGATWDTGCEVSYYVRINTPGTYKIWMRRYGDGGSANSCWVGLDYSQLPGAEFDNTSFDDNVWTWKTDTHSLNLDAGDHVFHIRRREQWYNIDRIILTTNTTYTPSGNGPAESPTLTGNDAPVVNAGTNSSAIINAPLGLEGNYTDDGFPLTGVVTVAWSKLSGPGSAAFADASQTNTTVTFDAPGAYTLRLTVNDGELGASDEVDITAVSTGHMVVVSQTDASTAVTEGGGGDTYRIALGAAPTASVTVDVSFASADLSLSTNQLVFTTGNWSNLQDVVVTAVDDGFVEGTEVFTNTHAVSSPDGNYDGITVTHVIVTVTDNDAYGNVRFVATNYPVAEPTGVVTVQVERVGGSAGAVSVDCRTVDGDAAAGQDYTAVSNTLSWAAGNTDVKTVVVTITNDAATEGTEAFSLELLNATGGVSIDSPSNTTVTITDDDLPGTLQFSTTNYPMNEAAGVVTVTVTRVGGNTGPVSVDYACVDGAATDGADYFAVSGTLSWTNGDAASQDILVTVSNDTGAEATETFSVILSNVVAATLGAQSNATVSIQDDDLNFAPTVNITWPAVDQVRIADTNQTLVLESTYSDDGNPQPPSLTLTWSKSSGPGTVTFGDANASSTWATFSTAGVYVVDVTVSDGESNAVDQVTVIVLPMAANGAFVESGGMVVIEGENYTGIDGRSDISGETFSLGSSLTDYVGTGYVGTDNGVNDVWATACEVSYDIDVSTPGTYKCWVRRRVLGNGNSIWIGVDGVQMGSEFDNNQSDYTIWSWKTDNNNVTLASGANTFQIRRRERGYQIDRIILTTDTGYTPTGYGPAESARNAGNIAPEVSAGTNASVEVNVALGLAGHVGDDGVPVAATSSWVQVSGPGTATFGDASVTNTTVTCDAEGVYVLRLIGDDTEARVIDEITVTVTAAPSNDQDGDGMDDAWEIQHFGSTNASAGGPSDDDDGDGFVDLHEFVAGTDPTNPASLFMLTAVSNQGATVALYFDTVTGRFYQVIWESNLLSQGWPILETNIVGDGSAHEVSDPAPPAQRFYRIKVRRTPW